MAAGQPCSLLQLMTLPTPYPPQMEKVMYGPVHMYLFDSSPPLQVRDRLPHLKAIVQYKGQLSQEYHNVYEVTCTFNN